MNLNIETPVSLITKPDAYDFTHRIDLLENNKVELIDACCQRINGVIRGEFEIQEISSTSYKLKLFNLELMNPYEYGIIISKIDSYEIKFSLVEEKAVFKNIPYKDIFITYKRHLLFEEDPFILFRENIHLQEGFQTEKGNYAANVLDFCSEPNKKGKFFTKLNNKYYLISDEIQKLSLINKIKSFLKLIMKLYPKRTED